jgi:hypothetical protein
VRRVDIQYSEVKASSAKLEYKTRKNCTCVSAAFRRYLISLEDLHGWSDRFGKWQQQRQHGERSRRRRQWTARQRHTENRALLAIQSTKSVVNCECGEALKAGFAKTCASY